MDATLSTAPPGGQGVSPGIEKIAVLIPVWRPDRVLLDLIDRLLELDFGAIIIVNDGSGPDYDHLFSELSEPAGDARRARIHLVRHAVNLGKGRALKTGLNYYLNSFPDSIGIVTADADGQHSAEDILAVAQQLQHDQMHLVLGSRRFQGEIPLRSRIGNVITRSIFSALTGTSLSDTQSGLRGIPTALVSSVLRLGGERYEYEMNMLTHAAHSAGIAEVPIETIYLDGNRSSHFNPIWDSMRIYFILLRFAASSLLAAGIDFIVFSIVLWMSSNLLTSMIAGRISSLANFALNRKFVFNSGGGVAAALVKYYALAAVLGVGAYFSIRFLSGTLGMNVLVAKILSETVLWLGSFSVQRTYIFPSRGRSRT